MPKETVSINIRNEHSYLYLYKRTMVEETEVRILSTIYANSLVVSIAAGTNAKSAWIESVSGLAQKGCLLPFVFLSAAEGGALIYELLELLFLYFSFDSLTNSLSIFNTSLFRSIYSSFLYLPIYRRPWNRNRILFQLVLALTDLKSALQSRIKVYKMGRQAVGHGSA